MTSEEALIQAGIMFAVIQGSGLLFMPIMGFLVDRMNRVVALAIATVLALVGYLWLEVAGPAYGASCLSRSSDTGYGTG